MLFCPVGTAGFSPGFSSGFSIVIQRRHSSSRSPSCPRELAVAHQRSSSFCRADSRDVLSIAGSPQHKLILWPSSIKWRKLPVQLRFEAFQPAGVGPQHVDSVGRNQHRAEAALPRRPHSVRARVHACHRFPRRAPPTFPGDKELLRRIS